MCLRNGSQQLLSQQHQHLTQLNLQQSEQLQTEEASETSSSSSSTTRRDLLGDLIEEVKQYRCLWDSSCRGFDLI